MADSLTVTPVRSNHSWLKAFGLALLIVLPIALAATFWLQQNSRPRARGAIAGDLISLVEPEKVPPQLALLVLADYPSEQVWSEAFRREKWDGALAIWLLGPVRSDRESLDTLLLFAEAQKRESPNDAAAYLLAAADVIRLSPELSDRERGDLLLDVGKRLQEISLEGAAVTEWRQASILAHYSPTLPAMYRATLLHDLATRYREVGATRLAERARANSAQVGSAIPVLAVPERIILDTDDLPEEPAELQAARARRRDAAQGSAIALQEGLNLEASYAGLRDALSAEGLLHRTWIEQELTAEPTRERQAALLLYHINWLQYERLLAWGFGGDAFPTWVERRGQIEGALHDAWDALELVRIEQSIVAGDQQAATLVQRDWWATRLVQHRLGRDPLLDREAVVLSMQPNNADAAGEAALRLDWIEERFWRVPREYVGKNMLPE